MKHLRFSNNGKEFLSRFLSISQKIDGSSLKVKKENGKILFLDRNDNEITKITRIFTTIYEEGISHLESKKITYYLPDGLYQFEYFPSMLKPLVEITKRPKNCLVLLKSNSSLENSEIADILDVDYLKPFFVGFLNDKQKELLFLEDITVEIIKEFFDKSFEPLINTRLEGVVLESEKEIFKILNTDFVDELIEKKKTTDEDNLKERKELLDVILSFDFVIGSDYMYSEDNFCKKLFEIFKMNFNKIPDKKLIHESDYFAKLNEDFLPVDIKKIVGDSEYKKEILRLMFFSLFKTRKKKTPLFNDKYFERFNEISEKLLLNDK